MRDTQRYRESEGQILRREDNGRRGEERKEREDRQIQTETH